MIEKFFISITAIMLLIGSLSCSDVIMSAYGYKKPMTLRESQIIHLAKDLDRSSDFTYYIDSSYRTYIAVFDTVKPAEDSNECSFNSIFIQNLHQPVQAMYFDKSGELISYFVNCSAGGFPNLNWNRDNNFANFPPKTLTEVNTSIKLQDILPYIKSATPISENLAEKASQYETIILMYWNRMLYRQSKRLLQYIQNNMKDQNAMLLLVNNDNFITHNWD